jgi:hypothetical protein
VATRAEFQPNVSGKPVKYFLSKVYIIRRADSVRTELPVGAWASTGYARPHGSPAADSGPDDLIMVTTIGTR